MNLMIEITGILHQRLKHPGPLFEQIGVHINVRIF